jgi:ABC-type branched-subunit amino acid transport system substrate-binding protein
MLPALHRGAALLIPDHISRVELLVRQLARSGKPPTAADGPLVLSTVEGTQAESLGPGHEVLTGLWVAPVAAESAATRRFVEAYTEAQGEPPGDQALLVYYALQQALTGAVVDAKAVLRIEAGQGGRLVPASAPKG